MWVSGFIFALKSALILSLLYVLFRLVFYKNNRFGLRRMVILAIIVLAIALPLLEIDIASTQVEQVPVINSIEGVVYEGTEGWVPPREVKTNTAPPMTQEAPRKAISWVVPLVWIYWAGFAISLSFLLIQLIRIAYFIITGERAHDLDRLLVKHPRVKHPFSFWRWTFFPSKVAYETDTWQLINAHEREHLRMKHSLDLMLMQLVKAFLWFTPAIYLLQRAMKENHEHQVDQSVVDTFDLQRYTQALLSVSLETKSVQLGHNFSLKSVLAKRIMLLNLSKSSLFKSSLSVLAFIAATSFIFYHTSLYGQKVVDPAQDQATITISKGVVITDRSRVPARFMRVIDKLQALNPDKAYLFELEMLFQPSAADNETVVYYDKLTEEENKTVPMSKLGTRLTDKEGGIDHVIHHRYTGVIREMDLTIRTITSGYKESKRYFKYDDYYYKASELESQPVFKGNIDKLYRLVTLDVGLPEGVDKNEIPESFTYEVYFNDDGYPVKFMLTEDAKYKNEKVYRVEGEVYKNLRGKASYYEWTAGTLKGKPVNAVIKVQVPTKYL